MVSKVIGSELFKLRLPEAWEKSSFPSFPTAQKTVPGMEVLGSAVAESIVLLIEVIASVERNMMTANVSLEIFTSTEVERISTCSRRLAIYDMKFIVSEDRMRGRAGQLESGLVPTEVHNPFAQH